MGMQKDFGGRKSTGGSADERGPAGGGGQGDVEARPAADKGPFPGAGEAGGSVLERAAIAQAGEGSFPAQGLAQDLSEGECARRGLAGLRPRESGALFRQESPRCRPCAGRGRRLGGMPRSVITSSSAEGGTIWDRLRRPNLLASQTAILRFATSTITRFTLASNRLGVLRP